MDTLPLFKDTKERKIFYSFIVCIFIFTTHLEYKEYRKFTSTEIYNTNGTVVNIYHKKRYNIAKIQYENRVFFTNIAKDIAVKRFDSINIYLISEGVSFYEYLQGMYLKSFGIVKIDSPQNTKKMVSGFIEQQHTSIEIASLYSALFIATALTPQIRELSANLGISHLIAISGFHLGVMSFVLYTLVHLGYDPIHKKYFPYRNKKYDISLFIVTILLSYLIFLEYPPSLLRAFVMFVFALFLLRNNIKLISFETLFIISILIIALFPQLLFSLSLWFSIIGVFYIFLYIHYFNHLNKYIQFFLFNFWLYAVMNPITHYFFGTTSIEQIYSPVLTILFTFFYPLSVFLHLIYCGDILDFVLQMLIDLDIKSIEVFTPLWLFSLYVVLSLLSIKSKGAFILLNIIMVFYTLWLFYFIL